MKTPHSGQSSRSPGDDREPPFARGWWEVDAEELWSFTAELCATHTYRGAEALTGVARETLRKIVARTSHPNHHTRKLLGELLLARYPGGEMLWKDAERKGWKRRVQFIELLPPGEAAAHRALAQIFDLARRFPDEVPEYVDLVQEWLDLQIQGEYWAERKFAEAREKWGRKRAPRRPRKPAPDGEPPPKGRRRKDAEDRPESA